MILENLLVKNVFNMLKPIKMSIIPMPIEPIDLSGDNFSLIGEVGNSNYNVELPNTNAYNSGVVIKTPAGQTRMKSYEKVFGENEINYNNENGTSAGAIIGLSNEEMGYIMNNITKYLKKERWKIKD
jgi:hypothetical protein